ncbi:MAG: glycerophosphodiester phosphodiesterase [Candidatus Thorarchaeota archaeon]
MVDLEIFGSKRPLIMAHRGDSGKTPENTLIGLKSAVEIGVDFLETDVRLTKDDELVLFHDDDLIRTSGEQGAIRDMTLNDLRLIDFGYNFTMDNGNSYPYRGKGHSIVTLREAFDTFPDHYINLDIKDKEPHAPELLASVVKECGRQRTVMVGSFHDSQIYRFRKIMPEVRTSASPSEVSRFVFALKTKVLGFRGKDYPYQAFQVPLKYGRIQVINERFVKAAHDRKIAVHVWTINERDDMEQLIDLGVDGIFTDEPALLKGILMERGLL